MTIFLEDLKAIGRLDKLHVTVVNVGSRKISRNDDYGGGMNWGVFAPNLTIYGVDADQDACDEANADIEERSHNWQEKHICAALDQSKGEATLYVTKNPMCSSLYPPNIAFAERFAFLSEVISLDFSISLDTITLDDFCAEEGIENIDFLQIDVQGADLAVLQGAPKILETVLALQIEVEFAPLYIGQPLFRDIDTFLSTHRFSLLELTAGRCARKGFGNLLQDNNNRIQTLWGDAFYYRDLLQFTPQSPARLFKLACIADALMFHDYALEILEYLTLNYGQDPEYNFASLIINTLGKLAKTTGIQIESLPIFASMKPLLKT